VNATRCEYLQQPTENKKKMIFIIIKMNGKRTLFSSDEQTKRQMYDSPAMKVSVCGVARDGSFFFSSLSFDKLIKDISNRVTWVRLVIFFNDLVSDLGKDYTIDPET
jgi:hypothetical protein